ncbi:13687_t:CDS:2, partial [Acaulospora colombiana]
DKDGNISMGFLPDRIAAGPATRIGIGRQTSANTRTKQNDSHIEIKGLTGDEANIGHSSTIHKLLLYRRSFWIVTGGI